jgi:hypothetical protein
MNNYSDTDKGVSGNPSGRPKMPSDFGAKVMRELKSNLTITENGKRKVITKEDGLVKQAVNKALTGNLPALRLAIELLRQECEKVAEEQRLSPTNLVGVDVRDLTTDELIAVMLAGSEKSMRARLEKSIRAELSKSIRAELEKSIRAEVEGTIGADPSGRRRCSRPKSTGESVKNQRAGRPKTD